MSNPDEQLAIIKSVGYGIRDTGKPCLWFDTMFGDNSGALQVFFGSAADKIIVDAHVYDVHNLEGKACWIRIEAGTVTFLRMTKMT